MSEVQSTMTDLCPCGETTPEDCATRPSRHCGEVPKATPTDPIVAAVCADLAECSERGQRTYGTTLAANPLSALEWARHAYEESRDQTLYLKRLVVELEKQQAEIERLRRNRLILAYFALGITPDRNTQTPEEVDQTNEAIDRLARQIVGWGQQQPRVVGDDDPDGWAQ